jgi:acetoin utilization deacetylase AcuC-like enzyme
VILKSKIFNMDSKLGFQHQSSPKQSVGIVTDYDMNLHRCKAFHLERPERLTSIIERLKKTDLLSKCIFVNKLSEAEDSHIKCLHSQDYIDYVRELSETYDEDKDTCKGHPEPYYNKFTNMAARKALEGAKILADKVVTGEWSGGYGVLRPSGHHAGLVDKINTFSVFNTVALTAKYAKQNHRLKKILILDWDAHHGDSTQKFLYEDSEILFMSFHRLDGLDGKYYYPGPSGSIQNIGEGEGAGYNLNFPWENDQEEIHPLAGDSEYIYVFERIALPIIQSFSPELILVSAGFDAGRGDQLVGLDLTQDGYAYMLRKLQRVQPKIIMCLEGGCNLQTISLASEACVRVLLGEELPLSCSETGLSLSELKNNVTPNKSAINLVAKALEVFGKYWSKELNTKELNDYDVLASKNMHTKELLCTGSIASVKFLGDRFLKRVDEFEYQFYESFKKKEGELYSKYEDLKEWMVAYYGKEKYENSEYISLENLAKNLKDAFVLKFKVFPSTHANDLNAIFAGKTIIGGDGVAKQLKIPENLKVTYDDLIDLRNLPQSLYQRKAPGNKDWNKFIENIEKQGKNLGKYEKCMQCVRAAQIVLDKNCPTELGSLSVLAIASGSDVICVKMIDIESKSKVKSKIKEADQIY